MYAVISEKCGAWDIEFTGSYDECLEFQNSYTSAWSLSIVPL